MTQAELLASEAPHRPALVRKIGRGLGNVFFVALLVLVAALVFFLVQSRFNGGPPTAMGYRFFAVLSGSMSPAFDTGSLVAVKPVDPALLQEGDVITFAGPQGAVSHRIVGIETEGGLSYVTKGDANDVVDSGTVLADQVIGVVALAIPWLGRILAFSQSRQGLLLMIVIPAAIILILEGRSLWKYAVAEDKKRAAEKERAGSVEGELE